VFSKSLIAQKISLDLKTDSGWLICRVTNQTDKSTLGRHKERRPTMADMNRLIDKAATVNADLSAEKSASVNGTLFMGSSICCSTIDG